MPFTSAGFLGFLAVVALLYALVPRTWRCSVVLAASYTYYWLASGWLVVLLLAATLLAFFAARSKSALLTSVGLLVTVLVFFKALPLAGANWLFPLGISYYTFKLAGYLVDTHWGEIEPERRLLPFLAYSSFFPQIVGGPIERAQSFLPQIERADGVPPSTVVAASLRITLGFFKKFVIADRLGEVVNFIYGHLTTQPGAPVLLGFYGYPLQMYADFSGLTDIALGAGVLLGIKGPENFNAPFSAASPSEYWRRWHMTLTLWLTDYVFTPLRMATRDLGNVGLVLSLLVNMVLIGLWHGFYWTFALFGVVHGIYLSVDALTHRSRMRWYKTHPAANRITDWAGPVVTFHLIAVAFVFFRADSIATVGAFFGHLFDGVGAWSPEFLSIIGAPGTFFSRLAGAYIVMEAADAVRRRYWSRPFARAVPRWARWSLYSCATLTVLVMVCLVLTSNQESSPFLYAIF
jgi:D-alanyl-lipoteichoic acid acyltransferase DltB (MBOAT superfamily)